MENIRRILLTNPMELVWPAVIFVIHRPPPVGHGLGGTRLYSWSVCTIVLLPVPTKKKKKYKKKKKRRGGGGGGDFMCGGPLIYGEEGLQLLRLLCVCVCVCGHPPAACDALTGGVLMMMM